MAVTWFGWLELLVSVSRNQIGMGLIFGTITGTKTILGIFEINFFVRNKVWSQGVNQQLTTSCRPTYLKPEPDINFFQEPNPNQT